MDKSIWKRGLAVFFASMLSVFALTACETTKGAGEDIRNAGEEMDDAID